MNFLRPFARAPRTPFTSNRYPIFQPFHRTIYTRQAEFITFNHQGSLVTQNVNVSLGDPHETFVMLPTEIGNAFRTAVFSHAHLPPPKDPELCPLIFHHATRHFVHESCSYPRLVIPQDLPRQTDKITSPATLWLFDATHSITLNGTPYARFAKHARDTLRDLNDDLEDLKNR